MIIRHENVNYTVIKRTASTPQGDLYVVEHDGKKFSMVIRGGEVMSVSPITALQGELRDEYAVTLDKHLAAFKSGNVKLERETWSQLGTLRGLGHMDSID